MDEKKIESAQQEEKIEQVALPQLAAVPPASFDDDSKGATRKKILLLVLSLLCVGGLVILIVFRSGIPIVDFWTVAGSFDPIKTEIGSVEKLEGAAGSRTDSKGALALYLQEDADGSKKQTVVHLLRGEVLATVEDSENSRNEVTLHGAGDAAWYSVVKISGSGDETRYAIALYDESGERFASRENMTLAAYNALLYTSVLDLVRFGQDVYRIEEDGDASLAFTMGAFSKLPNFTSKVDDYYFVTTAAYCYVYNDEAVLTATYHVPAGVMSSEIFILSDGTLFVQYVTYEGDNANEFTYSEGKEKYKLHHVLVSARNGEQTNLKNPEFFVISMLADDEELHKRGLNTGIANLAKGYYIRDSLLDMSSHTLTSVLMSNRGRITSEVGDIIPAMYGGEILGVAKNRWVAKNLAGERFLLNEWGAVVGAFPDETAEIAIAASIFICEGKIYNWDLEPLYDMWEKNVIRYELVGSSVAMYKSDGTVLLFDPANETVEELSAAGENKSVLVLGDAIVAVASADGKYELYNEHKEHLITLDAEDIQARVLDMDGKRTVELLVTTGDKVELYLATVEE